MFFAMRFHGQDRVGSGVYGCQQDPAVVQGAFSDGEMIVTLSSVVMHMHLQDIFSKSFGP